MALKDQLLLHFTSHPGEIYSGEVLADTFHVTRAAVWKAMNHLKKEGYRIDSVLGKGYIFSSLNEPLNANTIQSYAGEEFPLYLLESVDSTNNYAKKLVIDGCEDGVCVIADRQTKGRGRKGHTFYSPSSTGLYISYVTKRELEITQLYRITIAAAVAAVETIRSCTSDVPEIKWFNDLYLSGGKVAGILTEATADAETLHTEAVIIGIGINCHTEDFPEDLQDKAASLQDPSCSRNQIAGEFVKNLKKWLIQFQEETLMQKYREYSCILNHPVTYLYKEQTCQGTAVQITEDGKLVIEDSNHQKHTYTAKEISLITWD